MTRQRGAEEEGCTLRSSWVDDRFCIQTPLRPCLLVSLCPLCPVCPVCPVFCVCDVQRQAGKPWERNRNMHRPLRALALSTTPTKSSIDFDILIHRVDLLLFVSFLPPCLYAHIVRRMPHSCIQ